MIPDTPSSAASGMGDDALLRALIEELRPYASGPLGSIRVDTDDIRKIVDGFDALSAKDRELAEARAEIERLKGALKPFARLKVPWKPAGNAGAYSLLFDDIRRAQTLLESVNDRK